MPTRRYLANVFREAFDLFASPVAVEFRSDVNPYGGKERRLADERQLAAKKKAGAKKAANRAPRRKVATGKPTGRRPR